ncbi:hypothetical protein J437_LFUL011845 [Ladona fulva]|uniref:Uncharacterized protein n=1 Tax=Ladona fulva TaxID=123851 RepID=A0A8K0NZY1_LADFU|nr:hypothetical protein J437_LFUL011845 [Ladona fulva]
MNIYKKVICGAPAGILWDEFKSQLAEDFIDKDGASSDRAYNSALLDIQNRLRSHGRTLEEVGLPSAVDDTTETVILLSSMVEWWIRHDGARRAGSSMFNAWDDTAASFSDVNPADVAHHNVSESGIKEPRINHLAHIDSRGVWKKFERAKAEKR